MRYTRGYTRVAGTWMKNTSTTSQATSGVFSGGLDSGNQNETFRDLAKSLDGRLLGALI